MLSSIQSVWPVWRLVRRATLPALVALLLGFLSPAQAQYFGRNKVLWEDFDFQVLETEHFLIHYYPSGADAGAYVARLAERWHDRLSRFFDHQLSEKKPLIIYQDHADFQQNVIIPGIIGEGTGGVTESLQDRVILPLTGINADNNHVIGHELVHAFQFDIMRSRRLSGEQVSRLPLWMVEGLAEYLTEGRHDPATALQMRDLVLHENLPDFDDFFRLQPSPYQYGQAIWAYIAGRWGEEAARSLFMGALARSGQPPFAAVLGMSEREFFETFHSALKETYAPTLDTPPTKAEVGDTLATPDTTGASINIAPSLSPDGRRLAFISTRELAMELYLLDTETGELSSRLVAAERDSHFASLSFLDSSAAWSPDGRLLAFSVFAAGERRLVIFDVENRDVLSRIEVGDLKGLQNPVWSPDGEAIAFSAVSDGVSDLYLVNLEDGSVQQLTDDAWSDIQPAFSPDGRHLAFVTDRGPQSSLDLMDHGPMQIALLELISNEIELLSLFPEGKHINPQFSADGSFVYFIADRGSIADVYRYNLQSRGIERITKLKTGVTGITAMSPALSVSANGSRIAWSVLQDGGWRVYGAQTAELTPLVEPDFTAGGRLPPVRPEQAGLVETYLEQPATGLPPQDSEYPVRDYVPDIEFVAVAPAYIGVGTSDYGISTQGSITAYFGDLLNEQQIGFTFEGGTFGGVLDLQDTFGGELVYLNQENWLQWGIQLSHWPYVTGLSSIYLSEVDIDGETVPAEIVENLFQITRVDDLSVFAQFPLSINNRIEIGAGFRSIGFDLKGERLVFPAGFGSFDEEFSLQAPDDLSLQYTSAAFVRDTSRFGYVSPVRGTRLRTELEWATGDLEYMTALADWRGYALREPFSFAMRLFHMSRHDGDAEDSRLSTLDIGDSYLVRGYEYGSFDLSECSRVVGLFFCPEIDRLSGSRVAALNFEARLALVGGSDYGIFDFPVAPTDLALFVDAGAAWTSTESVEWSFERDSTERVPVVSAGVALRSLLAGILPLEFYAAHPFQRPQKDWVFGFQIRSGW